MNVVDGIDGLPAGLRFALALGMFDGVHRGHERALRKLVAAGAKMDARAVVLTFDPHPAALLRGNAPPLLCSRDERLARLALLGAETTVVQQFDHEFADQPPEAFLQRLRAGRELVALVMTAESAFGRDRTGMLEAIKRIGHSAGFRVLEVPRLASGGATLSSTRIRSLLSDGKLAQVRGLLGHAYALQGTVVRGDRRGRELGYPTANLAFDEPVALPPDGVYAVRAGWGGEDPLRPTRVADGVASLGVRPTFGGGARTFEVHLFDMDEDLYGKKLRVEFVRRQRGEKKFSSAAALVRQMDRDAARARQILLEQPRDRV